MLTISNLSVHFGKKILFDEVNIKFTKGNCYGIIGANGAGKSTLLKIISGEIQPSSGQISLEKEKRISVLEQDHFKYDNYQVLDTVMMGNKKLFSIKEELNNLYSKENFTESDGIKAGELTTKYDEMGGWNSESEAANLLTNVGISTSLHTLMMKELDNKDKVKVLIAQSIFGNPDVLILDEPTNDLDIDTISWLENFLANYDNTVIIVSHDRHFLDKVCTHICDIDFCKINIYSGNYSFWYKSSQLALKQKNQYNKKTEEKIKELQEFISRFSSNASKAKQATARKKMLDKIKLEDIKPSSRRYPAIIWAKNRELGDQIISIKNLYVELDKKIILSNISFSLKKGDKVALISKNKKTCSIFMDIITKNYKDYQGEIEWGITTSYSYLPLDNSIFFKNDLSLIDWLRQYTEEEEEKNEEFIRGFLGKMLFSGDDALKKCTVLSGGEKVRCMLSKMMLKKANILILDEPTNHLDLESITSLNNSLTKFDGNIIISSHDQEILNTTCNRIIELTPKGIIDKYTTYNNYINDPDIRRLSNSMY